MSARHWPRGAGPVRGGLDVYSLYPSLTSGWMARDLCVKLLADIVIIVYATLLVWPDKGTD